MAAMFTDNFDSYTDGDLTGQGTWSGNVLADVQGTVVQQGAKAIKFTTAAGSGQTNLITATHSPTLTSGTQNFYFRLDSNGSLHMIGVRFVDGGNSLGTIDLVQTDSTHCKVRFNNGPNHDIATGLNLGDWVKINAVLDAGADTIDISVNDGTPASFSTESAYTTYNQTVVRVDNNVGGAVTAYFDNFYDGATSTIPPSRLASMLVG